MKTATLNNKTTAYSFNDFGEMTQLISPETGTQSIDYDLTNNRVVKTDAKGIVHTTEMDILGRVKKITHDSLTDEYEEFNYDTAINGKGKIASVVNSNGTVSYEYDTLGRMSKKIQVVNGITKTLTYGYNTLGQLSSITYPSGLIVNYVYTRGLITSITLGGTTTGTVLNNAAYQPFDNSFPKSYQFNGTRNRITQFDTSEKLISIAIDSIFNKTITQDGEYNYLKMIDNLDTTKSFTSTYDSNNKIDVFALNGVNNKHYYDDSYNKTSNATMGFNYDIKNRLSSYSLSGNTVNLTYDDNGNTLTEGTTVYGYDLRNNLISVNKAGVTSTYGFNGLGQRTIKTVSGVNNYYLYDEAGNLAGEYDNAGSTVSEHIYLNGVPVGLVKANVLYNVHTDQIGTPRVITNASNVIVWKWDNTDPYGGNLPSVNTIVYNKRFSGQYFDNESKLHYNYYRTYNPLVGRYIQSDPIGLAAGFNTYNYVEGNPFGFSDSLGLLKRDQYGNIIFKPINGNHFEINEGLISEISRAFYIEGYIFTDKGRKVRAGIYLSPNINTNYFDDQKDYSANCHGLSFTNSQFWVDDTDVYKILEDEYEMINENNVQPKDIGIKYKNGQIIHSFTVKQYENGLGTYEKETVTPVFIQKKLPIDKSIRYYRKN